MIRRPGRLIYKLHKWAGLFAGIVILTLGLSGSVLVFHNELEAWENHGFEHTDNRKPVDIDKAYHSIAAKYPNRDVRLQKFSSDPKESLIFSVRSPEQRLAVAVHPSTGKILQAADSRKTISNWMLTLHYSLHANLPGEVIVFLAGIAFLISIITGIIVYRKAFADILLFRIKFRSKSGPAVASSLHRYVGVWAVFLNLFIVLSGLFISYSIVSGGFKKRGAPATIAVPHLQFSIDSVLRVLKTRDPDFQPSFIRFPLAQDKPVKISGKVKGQSFIWSKYYNSVSVNPSTGEISPLLLASSANTETRITSISHSIHFVEFAGWPVKLLFCLAGLSAPVLSISGFLLWRWRRKNRSQKISYSASP